MGGQLLVSWPHLDPRRAFAAAMTSSKAHSARLRNRRELARHERAPDRLRNFVQLLGELELTGEPELNKDGLRHSRRSVELRPSLFERELAYRVQLLNGIGRGG
ncbi:MAG TPA: hypothetical protein VG937_29710 [Polyangiaceae bacterium]|nr:hypothetical protein [Polyangiaceae bacterium]